MTTTALRRIHATPKRRLSAMRKTDLLIELPPVFLEGWFEVELVNMRTGMTRFKSRFRNLITNGGMNRIGGTLTMHSWLNALAVGTSNTAPAFGDAALGAAIASTTSDGGFSDTFGIGAGNVFIWMKRTRNFTEAQANGNLAELGFLTSDGSPILFNHSLIKDATETPIVITKTSEDQLRVIYELRIYPNLSDVIVPITINAVEYTTTTRPLSYPSTNRWTQYPVNMGQFGGNTTYGPRAHETDILVTTGSTTLPGAVASIDANDTRAAYINDSWYVDVTSTWGPATANHATGIGIIANSPANQLGAGQHMYQTKFAPKLPKDNLKRLNIVFRYSWARYP